MILLERTGFFEKLLPWIPETGNDFDDVICRAANTIGGVMRGLFSHKIQSQTNAVRETYAASHSICFCLH